MIIPRPKRRSRRLLQLSLRTLLVFVLLVSIGMSWLAVKLEKARRQKEAVEAVEKVGMSVDYDYQFDGSGPVGPTWLRNLLGEDFFADVVAVYGPVSGEVGDTALGHLRSLTHLEELYIPGGTEVTDAGLEDLRELTRLRVLGLADTQVTGTGLEHLKGLTRLQAVDLVGTRVTDAGLEHLKEIPKLHWLDLRSTQVTPEGVKKLREALPDCEIAY